MKIAQPWKKRAKERDDQRGRMKYRVNEGNESRRRISSRVILKCNEIQLGESPYPWEGNYFVACDAWPRGKKENKEVGCQVDMRNGVYGGCKDYNPRRVQHAVVHLANFCPLSFFSSSIFQPFLFFSFSFFSFKSLPLLEPSFHHFAPGLVRIPRFVKINFLI